MAGGLQPIVDTLTFDDTYYYLNTAWNHKTLGFPTFDGYNRTNGVQLLYYWLLFAMSHLFVDRYDFLIGALWLCGLMAAASVPVSYLAGRKLGLHWGALLVAASVTYLACNRNRVVSGVENALHILIVLGLFLAYFSYLRIPALFERKRAGMYFLLVGLCILNSWCRLDSWPLSVAVFLHASLVLRKLASRPWPSILKGIGLALLAAGLAFGTNYWMGGSAVPVSALWKVRVGDGGMASSNLKALALQAERGEGEGARPIFKKPDWPGTYRIVQDKLRAVFWVPPEARVWAPVVVLGLALAYCAVRLRAESDEHRRELYGFLVLGAGVAAHLLLLGSTVPGSLVHGFWYFAPQHAYLALALGVAVSLVPDGLPLGRLRAVLSPQVLAVAYLITMAALSGWERHLEQLHHQVTFQFRRCEAAFWIRDNLPTDARLASFNAGALGYFSERSVTNLDGLINSFEYYDNRLRYVGRVDRYMREQGIDYYVDYSHTKLLLHQAERVYRSALDDDKELLVLRLVIPDVSLYIP